MMHPPQFVRPLTASEKEQLAAGLRSREAFALRRSQILLASAAGGRPARIARQVGCAKGTVLNTLRAFEAEGLACLRAKSSRPKTAGPVLDAAGCERLRALLHPAGSGEKWPRRFGKSQSLWTLDLLALVAHAQGLTPRQLSHESSVV